jgi:hypothetical protein
MRLNHFLDLTILLGPGGGGSGALRKRKTDVIGLMWSRVKDCAFGREGFERVRIERWIERVADGADDWEKVRMSGLVRK